MVTFDLWDSGFKMGIGMVLLAIAGLGLAGCGFGPGHHGPRRSSSVSDGDTAVRSPRQQRRAHRRRHRRRMQKKRWGRSEPRTGGRADSPSAESSVDGERENEDETSETGESDADSPDDVEQRIALGEKTYEKYCSSCHGADREGSLFAYPSLENVSERLTRDEIRTVIRTGPGSMPSFDQLSEEQVNGLLEFLQES